MTKAGLSLLLAVFICFETNPLLILPLFIEPLAQAALKPRLNVTSALQKL